MKSRRRHLLGAALEAFTVDGYEGTPVSAIVAAAGMSKASFTYHFDTKDSLLIELVTPLLDALDDAAEEPDDLDWPDGMYTLLGRYFDALTAHRDIAIWIDGDKSVLNHPVVGARLTANNERMRRIIAGSHRPGPNVSAAAVLGAIWRPIRNLPATDIEAHRDEVLAAAMAAARTSHEDHM
jgi:AcrR family transcriptional regulator